MDHEPKAPGTVLTFYPNLNFKIYLALAESLKRPQAELTQIGAVFNISIETLVVNWILKQVPRSYSSEFFFRDRLVAGSDVRT